MKRNILLLLAVIISSFSAAREVSREEARSMAGYYLSVKKSTSPAALKISGETTFGNATGLACYIFNFESGGFVIISADDLYYPVIGYSVKGKFNAGDLPEGLKEMMLNYRDQIDYLRRQKQPQDEQVSKSWQAIRNHELPASKGNRGVEPLLYDTWDQADPYNYHCPADAQGPGGHALAGCGATAMSQIMHYWRWPVQGTGESSYYSPNYGTLSANYGETHYHFEGMVHNCSHYNGMVATLQYHAGVSVRMDYGPTGSSSYASDVPAAFVSYFRYKPMVTYLSRSNYTLSVWESKIKTEIDLKRPVMYRGQNGTDGHAFVLCGYNDDTPTLYYFNFGWSGNGNGYYSITDAGGWTINQGMICQIEPDDDYPVLPEPVNLMNYSEGTLEDGSGPRDDYGNNLDIRWIIDPQSEEDSITRITIRPIRFELGAGDKVSVYDGTGETAPLLGEFTATNPFAELTSTGNKMMVHFTSDASATHNGFLLEYTTTGPSFCAGTKTFTDVAGVMNDGSGSFNYKPNTSCSFKIQPPFASQITLYFNYFNTESENDYLKVINFVTSETLAVLSGNYTTPPGPIVVEGGKVYLLWHTNDWIQDDGFEIMWETLNVGETENELLNGFRLWPNPAQREVQVAFELRKPQNLDIRITDMAGQTVSRSTIAGSGQEIRETLAIGHLPAGLYNLVITGEEGTFSKKFMKE